LDEHTKSLLFKIINACYETGKLPKDFIKSKSITIPKKGNSTNCTNYRTITLLSHASKILLNIIKNRLKGKIEDQLGKEQFGFRRERGTREAILRLIIERRLDMNLPTYITFIGLEKAFDKVDWFLLFGTLKRRGIDWKYRRIILRLYKDQATLIDINGTIKEAKIRKGVRQGCPVSPYLFNLLMEEAIEEMKEVTNDVKINGEEEHSIRFADDIALVTESEGNMNLMLNTLSRVIYKFHMKINATKTKTMTARRDQIYTNPVIKLNDTVIQEVEQFYLGSIITYNNTSTIDIKKRITLAKQTFIKKKQSIN